jgi:hypothetical protein
MIFTSRVVFGTALVAGMGLYAAGGDAQIAPQTAPRDTPAQQRETTAQPTGRISGRIVAADTGKPIGRALVRIAANELPGGRNALTDNSGVFEFTALPAGRYTLTASKAAFVTLSYGQRRPLQSGTPLQLGDGQDIKGIVFQLPRGGAITGHVFDESGDPLPGTAVRVMRYQYVQGRRQLTPAGTAQTDDRGEYRVWGLNPGDYYVTAVARNAPLNAGGRGVVAQFLGRIGVARGGAAAGATAGGQDEQQEAYAPTYFPGVASPNEARAVTVGLSSDVGGIDFNILLVVTSRISGHVTSADGLPAAGGNVNLIPDGLVGRGGPPGTTYGSRIQRDGAFSIANVPPGRYLLRARGEGGPTVAEGGPGPGPGNFIQLSQNGRGRGGEFVPPQFASLPLTIDGDISDLNISLVPGATISGTVTFQSTRSTDAPQLNQFRIVASPLDLPDMGPPSTARVEDDGSFLLVGVPAGTLWLRAQAPRGWALDSVVLSGRDTIDAPFEIRGGEKITGVNLSFTDKQSEINGTVTDMTGTPITELTVLIFPTDSTLWRPQARQITTARPDQTGKFQLRGLPAGDYYLVAIDPIEQGEWFEPAFLDEHRAGATRVRLGDDEVTTQDFKIAVKEPQP